jgi:hypothetical protein
MVRVLDRLQWYLWHGKLSHARHVTPSVVLDLEAALAHLGDGLARQRRNAVEAYRTSIERDRQGERISTGVVKSTVHQEVRTQLVKQPPRAGSQWGAPLLRQTRTRG